MFHVVPTLRAAQKAVEAGVDGLVVEGGEGGGFKNHREVSTMVLLPLVLLRRSTSPIIAAGGICRRPRPWRRPSRWAPSGVQMGTRMVSAAESPVHENFKQAIVDAAETDTVFLNRHHRPGLRALRTKRSETLEKETEVSLAELGTILDLYFGGDMEASIALSGQVVGRIDSVRPVAEILHDTVREFEAIAGSLAKHAPASAS